MKSAAGFANGVAGILIATLAMVANADTIYVAGDCGNDAWTGTHPVCQAPDGPKATIQAGIDAADDGDEVLVADGRYTGPDNRNLDFGGKAITVRSENGPRKCIIDCQDGGRGFTFESGETRDALVDGFTITRGTGYIGGAILCENRSSPTIRNCVLDDNRAVSGGGIACISRSNPAIVDSRITGNTAESVGGGVFIGGHRGAASPTLARCVIAGNNAVEHGGGIWIGSSTSSPRIRRCTIFNNRADQGGGVYCLESRPTFNDCAIASNSADYQGGGMLSGNADPMIENCKFTANTVDGSGGGIFLIDSGPGSAVITDCEFTLNVATGGGGGGGISVERASPTIARCRFDGNIGRVGGGIGVAPASAPTIIQCVFTNNESVAAGGGLFCQLDASRIINCLVAGNLSHSLGGGFMFSRSDARVTNCTITRNTAERRGGGVFCLDSDPSLRNSVIWENRSSQVEIQDSNPLVRYCDVQGGWPGRRNIDADPIFVDPINGDYRLAPGSPCIDAARNGPIPAGITTDLDGNPRFVDDPNTPDTGHGTPPIVDMGAYEFQACDPCDMNCDGTVDASDIEPFIDILFNGATPCDACTADTNGDGDIDAGDIEGFINCLFP